MKMVFPSGMVMVPVLVVRVKVDEALVVHTILESDGDAANAFEKEAEGRRPMTRMARASSILRPVI
jgi:hypothetical protein